MTRLLVLGVLAYIGYRVMVALLSKKKPGLKSTAKQNAESTHLDPICGVYVSEEAAVIGRLDGERHYFCSVECLEKFREQLDHKTV